MMFKKTRKRIVIAIMSILTVLWIGTLTIIYISSYFDIRSKNFEMLKDHSEQYVLNNNLDSSNFIIPLPKNSDQIEANRFKVSTFYSVAFSHEGEVIKIENKDAHIYTNSDLEHLARKVLKDKKNSGSIDNLTFYVANKGNYLLISFIDNTVLSGNMHTLFRYTLFFGGIALILLFFLARYIANRIVLPLEQSYTKQRQFISDAGHELKTPISIVGANAELLFRELGDNQWLQNIQYENERMDKLVKQLLELARTEKMQPQMEKIDFSHLVNGEALLFESIAFEQGLCLHEDITQDLQINGNRTQLNQLVCILLDNAISHGRCGKDIWLSLTKKRNEALLSVINMGKEIPLEQQKKIFERFYRLDDVRNGEEGHYGLGLSIAKSIVESHKGKIDVQCFNGLVEFRILIPLV